MAASPDDGQSIKSFGSNKDVVHRAQRLAMLKNCRAGIPQRRIGQEPAGFLNPGVLCYRNSIISLLLNCEPFLGWLVNEHQPVCGDPDQSCLVCALATVAPLYWEHDDQSGVNRTENMLLNFWARTKMNHGRLDNPTKWPRGDDLAEVHEDADEFLTWLWQVWRADSTAHFAIGPDLDALFKFGVEQRIKCGNNQCRAERLGVMDDQTLIKLPLPKLPKNGRKPVGELLTEHFQPQPIEYTCGHCKKKSSATVHSTIREAPEILIIVLKRFEHTNNPRNPIRKIDTGVTLPEELDLTSLLAQSAIDAGENAVYTLQSVSSHAGNLKHGHYEAWLNGPGDTWYRVNDRIVTKIPFDKVNTNKYSTKNRPMTPYILAYVRQPPSSRDKSLSPDRPSPSPPDRRSPSPDPESPRPSKKPKFFHDPNKPGYAENSNPHKTELLMRLSLLDDTGSPRESFATVVANIDMKALGDNPTDIGLQLSLETGDKRYSDDVLSFLKPKPSTE